MFMRFTTEVQGQQLVSLFERIRRQQILREAEGCLELMTCLADRWTLTPETSKRLVQRALDALRPLDAPDDRDPYALYLQGRVLLTAGRFAEAIEPLKAATELDGDDLHTWLALGWCYKRTGRLDLAIQSLEEALDVDSEAAIVHYNLACYWGLAKNVKLAVRYLANAFDIEPDYRDKVGDEPDFNPIRHHPDFMALTTVIV